MSTPPFTLERGRGYPRDGGGIKENGPSLLEQAEAIIYSFCVLMQ
jgi:hypothetical protein